MFHLRLEASTHNAKTPAGNLSCIRASTKLLLEKGVITEIKQKLLEERAVYHRILNPTTQ